MIIYVNVSPSYLKNILSSVLRWVLRLPFPYLSNHALAVVVASLTHHSTRIFPNNWCHCFSAKTWQSRLSNQSNSGLREIMILQMAEPKTVRDISMEDFPPFTCAVLLIFGISSKRLTLLPGFEEDMCSKVYEVRLEPRANTMGCGDRFSLSH